MTQDENTINQIEEVLIRIILITNTLSAVGATLMILTYFKTANICISNSILSQCI
ncbi:unnamed protein product [Paramecium primaurelia]|uniref:Uncharacterized protein n=1 Tax=Paramecium primaurelia TaxID=5886 RepID=A0A8S1NGA5_PARPR|nr:unnamed protein product [Paramecium primaurelia]